MEQTPQNPAPDANGGSAREKRALSEKQYEFLFTELEKLQKTGAFTRAEVEAARDRYRVDAQNTLRETGFFCLMLFGVLALGIAGYLLFEDVWQDLSRTERSLSVTLPFAVSYALYYVFRYFKKETLADVFLFCGAGTFWFCANYLYMDTHSHPGWLKVVEWTIAASAAFFVAFCSKRVSLHALASFYILFAILEAFGDLRENLEISWFLLAFVVLGFYWSVRRASKTGTALYAILYALWSLLTVDVYNPQHGSVCQFFCYAMLISTGLFICEALRQYRFDVKLAKLLLQISLYIDVLILAAQGFFREVVRQTKFGIQNWHMCAFLTSVAIVALAWYLWAARKRRFATENEAPKTSFGSVLAKLFTPAALSFWLIPTLFLTFKADNDPDSNFAYAANALLNITALAVACASIVGGARKRDSSKFWSGVFLFLAWLVTIVACNVRNVDYIVAFLAAAAAVVFSAAWVYRRFIKTASEYARSVEETREPDVVIPQKIASVLLAVVVAMQIAFAIYYACLPEPTPAPFVGYI